jgi:hypothetical protein
MTGRTFAGEPLTPGVNVDPINTAAGMAMLAKCGYDDPHTRMVVDIALQMHARGEEPEAERTAIDNPADPTKRHGYGVNFTSWRMILAAAITAAHVAIVCTDRECAGCMFCDGGLFGCSRCGSFEGATTTDCPGEAMTGEQSDAVYAGDLDYRDGAWVESCSRQSPAFWRTSDGLALIATAKTRP